MLSLDNLIAQTRTVRDEYLQLLFFLFLFLVKHRLVRVQSGLTLGMTSLGSHTYPLQLALQRFAALRCRFLLLSQTLRLLLQPRRVVALPGDALATIQLENPLGHIVEEITVVGDGDHRTLILLQMLLQPVYRLCIEVVGRLVEQQYIGFLEQQTTQSHTATLTTREILDAPITRRTVQCRHCTLELRIHIPCISRVNHILQFSLTLHEFIHLVSIFVIFWQSELYIYLVVFSQRIVNVLYAFHHVLLDGLFLVERWVLRQIAHRISRTPNHIALILLVQTGNNLHQCRLTRSVQSDDANLGTIEKTQVDVFEHLFLILLDGLAHSNHREYNLLIVYCCHK